LEGPGIERVNHSAVSNHWSRHAQRVLEHGVLPQLQSLQQMLTEPLALNELLQSQGDRGQAAGVAERAVDVLPCAEFLQRPEDLQAAADLLVLLVQASGLVKGAACAGGCLWV
jgi:hypothetical protein